MKEKILVIALANRFGANTSKIIANSFGLFFFDIEFFIEYSLAKEAEKLLYRDKFFLDSQEKKLIAQALKHNDTLFYCGYETYINNLKGFEKCCVVYIALSFNQLKRLNEDNFLINSIAFEERNKILNKSKYKVESIYLSESAFAKGVVKLFKGEK